MNKSSGDIKKAAAEITAGATTSDEKLRKIYEFCQTQIHNTTFDPSLTDEMREKLPETKSMSDILKRKSGTTQFIDMLFGSLVNAAGFETRIAFSGDRSKKFMTPEMTNEELIHPAGSQLRSITNGNISIPAFLSSLMECLYGTKKTLGHYWSVRKVTTGGKHHTPIFLDPFLIDVQILLCTRMVHSKETSRLR
jgi:hypothetical protein